MGEKGKSKEGREVGEREEEERERGEKVRGGERTERGRKETVVFILYSLCESN